jgi:hypothetical protein
MAFTYQWSTLVSLARKNVRNIPTADIDALHCDLVSSKMAAAAPLLWRPLTTTIAPGTLPLVNGQQDYSVPVNIFKIGNDIRLTRTDVTPNQDINLNVVDTLATNAYVVSPYAIRNISHEQGIGQLRLEQAVQVPDGTTWEIRGEYMINPTKVVLTNQGCWFDDKYANVAMAGLEYWLRKLAGDNSAGAAATDGMGRVTYTGQLGVFAAMLREMQKTEDIQNGEMRLYPSEGISEGRNGTCILPWGPGA